MKKFLTKAMAIGLGLLIVFNSNSVLAVEKGSKDAYKVVVPQIVVDNVLENLYKELKNQDLALEQFLIDNKEMLSNIAYEYKIDKLNKNNWKEYKEIIQSKYCEDFSSSKYRKMVSFFDIYENKDKNEKIREKVSKKDLSKLEYLLPAQSTYVTKKLNKFVNLDKVDLSKMIKFKELGISDRATSLPNMKAAISYAEKYATNPNTGSYYYFRNGDCANFVSQILEAGGIKQEIYSETWKGWWHTTGNLHIPFISSEHKHSEAWTMADTFARYMGVRSTTKNHKNFSTNINAGTIIGADFDSDGDWDHIAFVTASESRVGSYGYYDYKVAQHTSNYLSWTSSDTNGWENIGNNGGIYAIIRQ